MIRRLSAPPGVDHEVIVVVYVPKRANPNLAVATPPVLGFDDGIFEDQGGVPEIDTVLVEISPPLFLIPFEGYGTRMCTHLSSPLDDRFRDVWRDRSRETG